MLRFSYRATLNYANGGKWNSSVEKPTEEGVADGDKLEQNGEAASNGFISYHRVVHCLYVIVFLKIKLT